MAKQVLIPGVGWVDARDARQWLEPGKGWIDEREAVGVTKQVSDTGGGTDAISQILVSLAISDAGASALPIAPCAVWHRDR